MADAVIDRVDPKDTALLSHLYNQVFKPERESAFFDRRLGDRLAQLFLVARIKSDAVGFFVGMELRPWVYYAWLVGVMPDARRMGIATQLMKAAAEWAVHNEYKVLRFECTNHQRPMLQFAIAEAYDIVGIRYDWELNDNAIIFEKSLTA